MRSDPRPGRPNARRRAGDGQPARPRARAAATAIVALAGLVAGRAAEAAPPAGAPPSSTPPHAPATGLAPRPEQGTAENFIDEVRFLYRLLSCSGTSDASVVRPADHAAYCRWFHDRRRAYLGQILAPARRFFDAETPAGVPERVVYPFGGGDLLGALATYPNATEYTTLSLEPGGDPRTARALDPEALGRALRAFRTAMNGLLTVQDSKTVNLQAAARGPLPGQLCFFLVGLAIHGYEPIALRYFHLAPDGAVQYLTTAETRALPAPTARGLPPDAFRNLELLFRPLATGGAESRGGGPQAAVLPRVHRHLAANLDDEHLGADASVLRHLEAKGSVAAMTKAASYLLWWQSFGRIRGYLLAHAALMFSDSTGIPPSAAEAAGFEVTTYGHFQGPFLRQRGRTTAEFLRAWNTRPYRRLTFRYGYPDSARNHHLMRLVRTAHGR